MSYHFRTLAVFDTLSILFCIVPFVPLINFYEVVAAIGPFFCLEYVFTANFCFGMASYCLLILSIDRLVATRFPLHASTWCTIKKARMCNISSVIFNFLLCFSRIFRRFDPEGRNMHSMCPPMLFIPKWVGDFEFISHMVFSNFIPPIFVFVINMTILITMIQNAADKKS